MQKRFKVIIEKEAEGGYSASVPSLPGCASQGEDLQECITNIKEAIALYVESLNEDNIPLPSDPLEIVVKDIEVSL